MTSSKDRRIYYALGILSLITARLLVQLVFGASPAKQSNKTPQSAEAGRSSPAPRQILSTSGASATPSPIPTSSWGGHLLAHAAIDLFDENVPPDTITRYLVVHWLESKMGADAPEREKIVAYEIHQVRYDQSPLHAEEFIHNHPEDFVTVAYVEYSVKPAQLRYSNWVAGGGTVDFNTGWIRHKGNFIAITTGNGQYIAYFIGGL